MFWDANNKILKQRSNKVFYISHKTRSQEVDDFMVGKFSILTRSKCWRRVWILFMVIIWLHSFKQNFLCITPKGKNKKRKKDISCTSLCSSGRSTFPETL